MSTPLDSGLQANADYQRIEFIKGELALCFTFSVVASAKYEPETIGNRPNGRWLMLKKSTQGSRRWCQIRSTRST
jgi:hypothetical protein